MKLKSRFLEEVHVMADLETMSVQSNAAIAQIGLVAFRPGDEPGEFVSWRNIHVSLAGQDLLNRHFDPCTIQWWMEQPDEAIKAVFPKSGQVSLTQGLETMRDYVLDLKNYNHGLPPERIWGHGSTMDCAIIDSAFVATNVRSPFKFRGFRDTRTIYDMMTNEDWSDMKDYGAKHDALADAMRQTVVLQRGVRDMLAGADDGTG